MHYKIHICRVIIAEEKTMTLLFIDTKFPTFYIASNDEIK